MSKYGDLVALLEWADRKKTPSEKPERKTKPDLLSDLIKQQQDWEKFQKYLKDQEKLNKKEDNPKKGLLGDVSTGDLAMILMSSFFLFGPVYYYYLTKLLLGH